MKFLEHVLLALLAFTCTTTLAAPTATKEPLQISINKKRDAFLLPNSQKIDFTKVSQHMDRLKAKYADSLQSYKANTGSVHPLQVLGIPPPPPLSKKRDTGSLPLTNEQQDLWHGTISLGGQETQCDYDTGSADIIINANAYSPGSSSTNSGQSFTASYGDGTVSSLGVLFQIPLLLTASFFSLSLSLFLLALRLPLEPSTLTRFPLQAYKPAE